MCSLVSYYSNTDAKQALRRARREAAELEAAGIVHHSRREQRTYRCDRCRLWHLTKMSLDAYESRQAVAS